jgi:hypothetical protein
VGIGIIVALALIVLSAYILLSGSAPTIEAFGAISGFLGGSAVAYLATRSGSWIKNGMTLLILLIVLGGLMRLFNRAFFFSTVLHNSFLSVTLQGEMAPFAIFLFGLGVIVGGITIVVVRVVNARS